MLLDIQDSSIPPDYAEKKHSHLHDTLSSNRINNEPVPPQIRSPVGSMFQAKRSRVDQMDRSKSVNQTSC